MTALLYAALGGHVSIVALLLDKGANIDKANKVSDLRFTVHVFMHKLMTNLMDDAAQTTDIV